MKVRNCLLVILLKHMLVRQETKPRNVNLKEHKVSRLSSIVKRGNFKSVCRTSPVVQWLGICASTAGDLSLTPGSGTKIPHATWHGGEQKQKQKPTKPEERWREPGICSRLIRSTGNNLGSRPASHVEGGVVGLSLLPVQSDSISA